MDIVWNTPLGVGSLLHRGCCIDWDGRIWTTGTKGGGITGTWLAYSDDKGASWTSVIAPWYSWGAAVKCENMVVDHVNRIIYAIVGQSPSSKRLYYSIDGGANWSYNAGPVTSPDVQYFSSNGEWVISNDGALVGIEYYGGIFRTTDYGATWALAYPVPSGLGGFSYSSISKDPNNSHIHATYRSGTYTYQFLKSTDNGQTWVGYTPNSFDYWMYATSQVITASGAQIIGTGYGNHGITRSPDFGLTIANPFISTYRLHRGTIDDTGRIWFVGDASPDARRLALVYSDDDGLTWETKLAPASVVSSSENRINFGAGAVIIVADGQPYAGVYATSLPVYVPHDGAWKRPTSIHVPHAGAWKQASQIFVPVNGEWTSL